MRITDETVRSALLWARNYKAITQFKKVAPRGRKWLIQLPAPRVVGSGLFFNILGIRPEDVVPQEIVLTSREALAFAYGCAAGGIHDRAEFARENWGWGAEEDEPSDSRLTLSGGSDGESR